eukprot:CAMPEP_0204898908 /NCGR_PEP_ID=MMETSP1397-20131031/1550_1 /ASSEMBLY_ACC=CAM_ASM_000891 /TAXON_ID=49980 /ORGANISM="Climacostomum Climacostomum virens, Strain Stock W-24" /LENGTH=423 /DNA_ID=CAMNT_0052066799 /DNA_START=148 /DNA_END=1419 /DNA_ORIENTATION=-
MIKGDVINHSMADKLGSIEQLQAKARRFNNEIKAFTHGLPCHASSSIFVVMDDNRMDLMKALISGPEDSPYEHGLYLFDILCPETYPEAPPHVSIMTTGDGTVRFNPNLYDSGYVCLSIINTWDSMPEEMWNPQQSNLLQVLISIQALVMDEYIIQKEPYYESLTKESAENRAYSDIVRYNNVKWAMLETLRRPAEEFKHVIFRHFALKKQKILKTIEAWVAQAEAQETCDYYSVDCLVSEHNHPTCDIFMSKNGYLANLRTVVESLKEELSLLPEFTTEEEFERALLEYEALNIARRAKLEEQQEAENAAKAAEWGAEAVEAVQSEVQVEAALVSEVNQIAWQQGEATLAEWHADDVHLAIEPEFQPAPEEEKLEGSVPEKLEFQVQEKALSSPLALLKVQFFESNKVEVGLLLATNETEQI